MSYELSSSLACLIDFNYLYKKGDGNGIHHTSKRTTLTIIHTYIVPTIHSMIHVPVLRKTFSLINLRIQLYESAISVLFLVFFTTTIYQVLLD